MTGVTGTADRWSCWRWHPDSRGVGGGVWIQVGTWPNKAAANDAARRIERPPHPGIAEVTRFGTPPDGPPEL